MQCDFRKQYQAIHKYTFLNCTLAISQLQHLMIRQRSKFRHSLSKMQLFYHWKQTLISESYLLFLVLCKFKANLLKSMSYEEVLISMALKEKINQFLDARIGRQLLECLGSLHISLLTQIQFWGLFYTISAKKDLIRLYVRPS